MRRFITIVIFAVTARLVALAIAKPIPNRKAGGMAIPLARHSSFLDSNDSVDLDIISSNGISVREKILSGLENYEMNAGTMHPFAVKRGESGLGTCGASAPLEISSRGVWMAEISIGTPPKTFNVRVDTGAADMWVLETGCWGTSGHRDLWDPHASKSVQHQEQLFKLAYADRTTVKGALYTDNVTIAGFTADPQIFGAAIWFTGPYDWDADGLLGLAFPSISDFGASPLLASLVRQNRLINPTISFKLSSYGAEMYIGGENSMLYKGDIVYTRLTHPGFWQVSMDDLRVNGNIILKNVPAIFDTGANYIYGNSYLVSELYRSIGGTFKEYKGFGFYHLPCDSFPTLSLTFGGRSFVIPLEVLRLGPIEKGSPNCFSSIVAELVPVIEPLVIGMPFLQGVYSVFDYGTSQVGFADLA